VHQRSIDETEVRRRSAQKDVAGRVRRTTAPADILVEEPSTNADPPKTAPPGRVPTTQGTRTDVEKRRALRAISFELRQMAHATRLQREIEAAQGDPMASNAYLDSSAIHARALIDFFTQSKAFKTDICRTDFAPDWTPVPQAATHRIKSQGWMLNKYLAHLTWERVAQGGPSWNYPGLTEDILDIAEAWCQHLAATDVDLAEYFAPMIESARTALTT
jgi:hypothetical protein